MQLRERRKKKINFMIMDYEARTRLGLDASVSNTPMIFLPHMSDN